MHIPINELYRGSKNVITFQDATIDLAKAAENAVKKTKITKTADSVTLSVPKASVVLEESTTIPKNIVDKTIKEFKENETNYNILRGRINAQADQAGMRIVITHSESHPGKLEVQIADKSLSTSRELARDAANIFLDIKNAGKHFNALKTRIKNGFNGDKTGGITNIIVDPKENYAKKIAGALLDAIEAKEFARIQK